jgi:tetratricopeptide (TPR) repeat protein
MRSYKFASVLVTAALVGILQFGLASDQPVSKEVEQAVLAEDWAKVADLLTPAKDQTLPPVARLIKAHACLALNRNNESLCLFLHTKAEEDIKQWVWWTDDLARRQPTAAVAHYLYGDAAARQKRWKAAIESFDASLRLGPQASLTLNARAVAHAAQAEWDASRENFIAAVNLNPPLSDLFASRGGYILQRRTDPQKALDHYEQALKISPNSMLALNGRGCARILLRQWEAAMQDLETAVKLASDCSSELAMIFAINLDRLIKMVNETSEEALSQVAGIKPGMSIDEKMDRISRMPLGQQQLAVDILNNARNWNQRIAGNPFIPKIDLGLAAGVKGSLFGPVPYVEGRMNLQWDIKETSSFNLSHQTDLLRAISSSGPSLTPNKIDNFTAWTLQHAPGSPYPFLAQPGGVSSKEIAAEPIEAGSWNVVSFYGLLYDIGASAK